LARNIGFAGAQVITLGGSDYRTLRTLRNGGYILTVDVLYEG
jgi:hypothetical protein